MNVGFKPFSTVASIQAGLDALRQLMQDNKLKADDIAALRADVGTMTHVHCAWEYKSQGVTAAQMNIFFGLAAIAVDGDAFIHQYREDRLRDPRILDFIKRIECNPSAEIDNMGPLFRHAARITVKTRDGREHYKEMLHRLGSPENSLKPEQVHEKFRTLARHCLGDKEIDEVIGLAQGLDKLESVDRLTGILSAAKAR
jgi:2-methylcitrate dehydratase PrpD